MEIQCQALSRHEGLTLTLALTLDLNPVLADPDSNPNPKPTPVTITGNKRTLTVKCATPLYGQDRRSLQLEMRHT